MTTAATSFINWRKGLKTMNKKNTATTVRIQAVGKIAKCRDTGAHVVSIKAVSQCKRKESKK